MSKGGRDGGGDRGEKRDFHSNDRPFQKPAFEQPRTDGDTKRRLESIEYKLDKVVRAVDMLLASKLPKASVEEKKDVAKVKEELTAVVKKVSKEIEKDAKEVKKEVKKIVKEVKEKVAKVKAKGKK